MIVPAARKATPAVTASMMRIGSVVTPSLSPRVCSTISKVRTAKVAAASEISICVRNPAGRERYSRSSPISNPSAAAASKRNAMVMKPVCVTSTDMPTCSMEAPFATPATAGARTSFPRSGAMPCVAGCGRTGKAIAGFSPERETMQHSNRIHTIKLFRTII